MKPLFSRLYDVLARSTVHQREDYLTEIFAECLESEAVAERVLTLVLGNRDIGIVQSHADTQRTYRSAIAERKSDRPDVTWRLETDDGLAGSEGPSRIPEAPRRPETAAAGGG